MAKNFFNLPPPWDPGYAIPSNVMSEGLARHAYVTRMMPRGTYDASTDGSAGYAIPQYVLNEGTGRGTFTTKWLPRGYYGPRLPNYLNRQPVPNLVLSGLGAVEAMKLNAVTGLPSLQARGVNAPPPPKAGAHNSRPDFHPELNTPRGAVAPYGVDVNGQPLMPPPQSSFNIGGLLPYALLGGAAFVVYKLITKKKAPPEGTP